MLTSSTVHYGLADAIQKQRQQSLMQGFQLHPMRFKGKPPTVYALPTAAWINKPNHDKETHNSNI